MASPGGYTFVKDYVRLCQQRSQEMFVPLAHAAGTAQADFGQAQVIVAGVKCTAHYLAIDLPHSDDIFVMAFPAETTEAFLEGFDRNENTVCSMAHRISGQTMHNRTTLNTINELGRNHIFLPLVFPIL